MMTKKSALGDVFLFISMRFKANIWKFVWTQASRTDKTRDFSINKQGVWPNRDGKTYRKGTRVENWPD